MTELSNREIELLLKTPDKRLKIVFPDHTRKFLREEKRRHRDGSQTRVIDDAKLLRCSEELSSLKIRYKKSLQMLEEANAILSVSDELQKGRQEYVITESKESGSSEAIAVIVASDWHYEEIVVPSVVSGLNSYNLSIAKARVEAFFRNAVRLVHIFQKDIRINTIILGLLGDFITGNIHDENLETAQLTPTMAIIEVQNRIASGIRYVLEKTDCNLIIPCCVGNHSRITETIHVATENGNSLEWLLYRGLEMMFEGESRINFILSDSYHSYVKAYGVTLRFHHGHAIRYNGGIGGVYIPVNKAIAQWNKAKHADIDVLAHWHQQRDGGNFLINGSLIGFNGYALRIKADFETPRQLFFLIDKNRGKTIVAPILPV